MKRKKDKNNENEHKNNAYDGPWDQETVLY